MISIDLETPKEKDEVIYATCRLCSLHQQTGFIDGIRLVLKLSQEINTKPTNATGPPIPGGP